MKQVTFAILCLLLTSCSSGKQVRECVSFDNGWSVEADPSAATTTVGGMSKHQKHFKISKSDKKRQVYIDFDSVCHFSKAWLNDHLLDFRPSKEISFRYDLTPYLNYGSKPNVLVVQVDNSGQQDSNRHSGSDIFRNTWLVKTGKIHVDNRGTRITTPVINADKAMVEIETILKNHTEDAVVEVTTLIQDRQRQTVVEAVASDEIKAGDSCTIIQTIEVLHPERWELDNPYLYTAVTEVRVGGKLTDRYETPFGIRPFF